MIFAVAGGGAGHLLLRRGSGYNPNAFGTPEADVFMAWFFGGIALLFLCFCLLVVGDVLWRRVKTWWSDRNQRPAWMESTDEFWM